ncbi:MAG TPA: hypothetical protein VG841_10000 [Caulobacterales bacterium]|nr:hypothetical protein [Caulobacterales bacterium]
MPSNKSRPGERIFRERPKARTIEDYEPPLAREQERFTPLSRPPARRQAPDADDEAVEPRD